MEISNITNYPIKSLAGNNLEFSVVEERGLENDRRYMLVDENNDLLTQRDFAGLATVSVRILKERLIVSKNEKEGIEIANESFEAESINVRVWDSRCAANQASKDVNDWFTGLLGINCRLVKMPDSTRRQINEKFNKGDEIVSFADGYPILIIAEESLKDLNSRLGPQAVPMSRFRPNLTISGAEPFEEDSWKRIRIGETILRATKPCARCVVTTINQTTGKSDVHEPLKTLAEFRKGAQVFPKNFEELGLGRNDVLFGYNFVPERFGGVISVGDTIEIID